MASSMSAADKSDPLKSDAEPIPAEILAVIVAAATAFLGKKLLVRGITLERSPARTVSRWTQQGRAYVQSSHNLRRHS